MPKANLGEIEIYYEEKGQGEPVLLAPPSWWPCDTWNVGVVPFLSKRFKTMIFDCRGTGRSDKPTSGYSVSQFARDCAGLLKHMHISLFFFKQKTAYEITSSSFGPIGIRPYSAPSHPIWTAVRPPSF